MSACMITPLEESVGVLVAWWKRMARELRVESCYLFFFCIISQLFLINPVLKLEEELLFAWSDFLILKGTLICMEGIALERLHRKGLIWGKADWESVFKKSLVLLVLYYTLN